MNPSDPVEIAPHRDLRAGRVSLWVAGLGAVAATSGPTLTPHVGPWFAAVIPALGAAWAVLIVVAQEARLERAAARLERVEDDVRRRCAADYARVRDERDAMAESHLRRREERDELARLLVDATKAGRYGIPIGPEQLRAIESAKFYIGQGAAIEAAKQEDPPVAP